MMHCNEVKPIINTPQSGFMKIGMPDDVNDPDLWSVNWIVCGIWFPTLGKTSCKMFRTRPWGERRGWAGIASSMRWELVFFFAPPLRSISKWYEFLNKSDYLYTMYTHLWTTVTVMYFHAKCLTLTAGNRWFPHMKLCYSRSWAQRRQKKQRGHNGATQEFKDSSTQI